VYAIIQLGASQVKVSEGDTIDAIRMNEDVGKTVTLDKVLLYAKGTDIRIGQPYLNDVKVTAKVMEHGLNEKIVAFKYRKRKNSAQKIGSRSKNTVLNITKISA